MHTRKGNVARGTSDGSSGVRAATSGATGAADPSETAATTGLAAAEGVAGGFAIVAQARSTRASDSTAGTTGCATSGAGAGAGVSLSVAGAENASSVHGAGELAADDQFKTPRECVAQPWCWGAGCRRPVLRHDLRLVTNVSLLLTLPATPGRSIGKNPRRTARRSLLATV